MIGIALFGAGRIGAVHAESVAKSDSAKLLHICDVNVQAAERLTGHFGGCVSSASSEIFADPSVDAVVIASSTDTHVELIIEAARAKKAIFCEKPIDLELGRVDQALAEVKRANVPLVIGFNRRFDRHFSALERGIADGLVGAVEMVLVTSRDPGPPPIDYLKRSGGLFKDMMIHDFDMVRWLLGEEPVEVFASASCLVSDDIRAVGDVDTAMVTMKTAKGALCQITNSRRAVYGYDQRLEVLGALGMLQAKNPLESTVVHSDADTVRSAKPPYFFMERYLDAYRQEMRSFLSGLDSSDFGALATANDGRQALVLAEAASLSLKEGRAVEVKPPS